LPQVRKEPPLSALRAMGLVGVLGTVVALCTVGGVLAGVWLDQKIGTGGLLAVLGVFAGLASGIYGAYRLVARDLPWNQ